VKTLLRRLSPAQKAVLVLYGLFAVLTFLAPPASRAEECHSDLPGLGTHDCFDDPLNAQDCMRTPGPSKVITIIFSGLPAVSVIAPNLTGGTSGAQPPLGDDTPPEQADEEPPTRYVVQVSSQKVTVKPEEEASLALKAWKTVGGAPWTPAPEVQIRLAFSSPDPSVRVSPQEGSGEMRATISIDENARAGFRTLTVIGIAPEAQTSAEVQVDVQTEPYRLKTSADRFEITVGETVELDVRAQTRRDMGGRAGRPDPPVAADRAGLLRVVAPTSLLEGKQRALRTRGHAHHGRRRRKIE
jgi:hypothetical protein